ncbi:MAG: hypothetical protein ABI559_09085 [Chloroflexota bacterium]
MPELALDQRVIGGLFDVDESARRLIHYRYAEISCMEALDGWVATMASPKLKIIMAEHAYHDALHADAIGRRLPELRIQENVDMSIPPTLRVADVRRPPNEEFARLITDLQGQHDELLRLTGLYRVLKPHLAVYYRHHAAVTDQICDAPTVRTLKFILIDEEEHIRFGQAIYEELADTPAKRRAALEWQMHLEELLAASGGVIGHE